MPNLRLTRVNELLRREIGAILLRIMQDTDFDLAAVTVTRVTTSSDLRHAQVLVSIRDHPDQRDNMLRQLRNRRVEIQKLVSENVVLKYTPRLSFDRDPSLQEGDRVLDILRDLGEGKEQTDDGYETSSLDDQAGQHV